MTRWRPVLGFEGIYSVSDFGDVRRDARGPHTRPGLLLAPRRNRGGYLQVGLRRDGKPKRYFPVHTLVALAFLGDRPPGMTVNHKDGVKTHNAATNMEWLDTSGQALHAYSLGLRSPQRVPPPMYGAANPAARLTPEAVREIRSHPELPLRVLAERFGVGISTIHRVRRNLAWLGGDSV